MHRFISYLRSSFMQVTELGVSEIVLVKTQNSNADYDDEDSLLSLGRVCIESAEQCERLSVPRLVETISFEHIQSHWKKHQKKFRDNIEKNSGILLDTTDRSVPHLLVCRERFLGGISLLQVLLDAAEIIPVKETIQLESSSGKVPVPSNKMMTSPVGIFIGPEGGFTVLELERMSELKDSFQFVTLGDR